ncbi:peptidase C14 caspase catalytic subunit p20 [Labilithrix luteola]|uniref:Peptidase C14 caspase catalytic subunit p20 n=1 Tax=Labilithrix luteola TaxID=1391654 RepID=A0A0K1Q130_9BACT|nr:caspase family protein [Labilithrix luteola]AKU99331.1 peptidase C14 caspase catalytic subunit p20 [Labilithrix luteola]
MSVRRSRAWAWAFALLATCGVFFVARVAHAEPVRLLVSVGHKDGLAAERPLRYADTDAARVRDVLVSMGGVEPKNAVVLAEPTAPELFGALDRLKAEAQKRKPEDVTLIFYFSGHGDREAIHLGDSRVPIADLSARLAQIPAALRIVVTDACRATRDKGMTAEAAFPISLGQLPQASGSVWLNAASDGEAAQESDELQGAIFTHSWLNGLRGAADANGDSRVTLDESFAFAHSQTLLRSAKSSGVLQKPEAVLTLKETAPVVLTQTVSRLATVSLPPRGIPTIWSTPPARRA